MPLARETPQTLSIPPQKGAPRAVQHRHTNPRERVTRKGQATETRTEKQDPQKRASRGNLPGTG